MSLEGAELQPVCKCDIGHTRCISMQLFSYALSRTKGCSISGSDGVLCDVMCCSSTVEKGSSPVVSDVLGWLVLCGGSAWVWMSELIAFTTTIHTCVGPGFLLSTRSLSRQTASALSGSSGSSVTTSLLSPGENAVITAGLYQSLPAASV